MKGRMTSSDKQCKFRPHELLSFSSQPPFLSSSNICTGDGFSLGLLKYFLYILLGVLDPPTHPCQSAYFHPLSDFASQLNPLAPQLRTYITAV